MLRWLWLSALVVVLDQVTKLWAEAALLGQPPLNLLPHLDLILVYNTGAAFSFLSDAGGWQRWFFVFMAGAVTLVLVFWLRRLRNRELWLAVALSLIIGGAVGNLLDRLLFGHVIDFIDIYYRQWHWPAFNVADSAISVGVVLILIDGFFGRKDQDQKTS